MTYKDLFDEAFGSLENGDRRMSDSEFAAAVRAKAQRLTVCGTRSQQQPRRLPYLPEVFSG